LTYEDTGWRTWQLDSWYYVIMGGRWRAKNSIYWLPYGAAISEYGVVAPTTPLITWDKLLKQEAETPRINITWEERVASIYAQPARRKISLKCWYCYTSNRYSRIRLHLQINKTVKDRDTWEKRVASIYAQPERRKILWRCW
jgi:hypothetical protein